jgi:hypothetical protein
LAVEGRLDNIYAIEFPHKSKSAPICPFPFSELSHPKWRKVRLSRRMQTTKNNTNWPIIFPIELQPFRRMEDEEIYTELNEWTNG